MKFTPQKQLWWNWNQCNSDERGSTSEEMLTIREETQSTIKNTIQQLQLQLLTLWRCIRSKRHVHVLKNHLAQLQRHSAQMEITPGIRLNKHIPRCSTGNIGRQMGTRSEGGLLHITAVQEQKGLPCGVLYFLPLGTFQGGLPSCLSCCSPKRVQTADPALLQILEFIAARLLPDLMLCEACKPPVVTAQA